MHKGSKETYDFIADWIDPNFFYSKKDVWHRMGMIGVFGDYVLSCTSGAIAEIGCGESSIYLSYLARKYGRKIYHCDMAPDKILNPLTVKGYMLDEDVSPPTEKHVYLNNAGFFMGSSDDFFKEVDPMHLALVFIDGDHHYEQAKKDFDNFLPRMVDHGYIILHDTYPPNEEYLSPDSACGDVYRLRQEIEKDPRVDCITLTRGCAMGVGMTICRKKPAELAYYHD